MSGRATSLSQASMQDADFTTPPPAARPSGSRLGDRLRSLRLAAGLTQTELAGERFSKEYVSQIERGKTRPTRETIDWLAERLGVDAGFLASGVSTDERGRVEAALARAEALSAGAPLRRGDRRVRDRARGRRRHGLGRARGADAHRARPGRGCRPATRASAIDLLTTARSLAEGPQFSDVDRADVLFRLGVCRYKLSSVATAIALFDEALSLAERSGLPSDLLRAEILGWRSPLPPAPARSRGRARGRRARARAGAGAGGPPRAREHVLPGFARLRADGPLAALAELRGAGTGAVPASSPTSGTWASCSRTSAGSTSCSATPSRRSSTSRRRSRSRSRSTRPRTPPRRQGSLATVHLHLGDYDAADSHARHALELLDGSRGLPARDRPQPARARSRDARARAGSTRRSSGSAPPR